MEEQANGTSLYLSADLRLASTPLTSSLYGRKISDLSFVNDSYIAAAEAATASSEAFLPQSTLAAVVFAYALTFVLTVIGNGAALVVFSRGRRSNTNMPLFFTNLAVADLIGGVVCLPVSSMAATKGWLLPEFMCPVLLFLQQGSVTASAYINASLSVDRFLAVNYRLAKLTGSRAWTATVIGLVWLISAGFSSVQLAVSRVVWSGEAGGSGRPLCVEDWRDKSDSRAYTVALLVVTYAVPASIMVVMYGLIRRELWSRQLPPLVDRNREDRLLAAKRKVVQMLIVMAALFTACRLPLYILFIFRDFYDGGLEYLHTESQFTVYFYTSHLLATSNSFQNPIVYGFLSDQFRSGLAELLVQCCPLFHGISPANRVVSRASALSTNATRSEVPPADSWQSEVPPADSWQSEVPPANSRRSEVPPANSRRSEVPPANSRRSEVPPANSGRSEVPPTNSRRSVPSTAHPRRSSAQQRTVLEQEAQQRTVPDRGAATEANRNSSSGYQRPFSSVDSSRPPGWGTVALKQNDPLRTTMSWTMSREQIDPMRTMVSWSMTVATSCCVSNADPALKDVLSANEEAFRASIAGMTNGGLSAGGGPRAAPDWVQDCPPTDEASEETVSDRRRGP